MKIAVSYFERLNTWPNTNFKGLCDSILSHPCDVVIAKYSPEELLIKHDYDAVFLLRGGNAISDVYINHYKKYNILIALWHDDLFRWYTRYFAAPSLEFLKWLEAADLVYTMWIECFQSYRLYNKYRGKLIWSPWSVADSIIDSDIDWAQRQDRVLLSGNTSITYPFRRIIKRYASTVRGQSVIDTLEHHGYRAEAKAKMVTGHKYYNLLKTYKGAIATSGKKPGHYHRAKYMEVSACGCLPFLEYTPDLHYLGFIDGINCVIFDRLNFEAKLKIIHTSYAAIIAHNAREMVRQRHLHSHRAKMIISTIVSRLQKERY
jgi:hypothetical protein